MRRPALLGPPILTLEFDPNDLQPIQAGPDTVDHDPLMDQFSRIAGHVQPDTATIYL
jgi:hypothetical protein